MLNNIAVNGPNFAPHNPHDWSEELEGKLAQRPPLPTFRPTLYSAVLMNDTCTIIYRVPRSIYRLA